MKNNIRKVLVTLFWLAVMLTAEFAPIIAGVDTTSVIAITGEYASNVWIIFNIGMLVMSLGGFTMDPKKLKGSTEKYYATAKINFYASFMFIILSVFFGWWFTLIILLIHLVSLIYVYGELEPKKKES